MCRSYLAIVLHERLKKKKGGEPLLEEQLLSLREYQQFERIRPPAPAVNAGPAPGVAAAAVAPVQQYSAQ